VYACLSLRASFGQRYQKSFNEENPNGILRDVTGFPRISTFVRGIKKVTHVNKITKMIKISTGFFEILWDSLACVNMCVESKRITLGFKSTKMIEVSTGFFEILWDSHTFVHLRVESYLQD